jgi:hypothetical protein
MRASPSSLPQLPVRADDLAGDPSLVTRWGDGTDYESTQGRDGDDREPNQTETRLPSRHELRDYDVTHRKLKYLVVLAHCCSNSRCDQGVCNQWKVRHMLFEGTDRQHGDDGADDIVIDSCCDRQEKAGCSVYGVGSPCNTASIRLRSVCSGRLLSALGGDGSDDQNAPDPGTAGGGTGGSRGGSWRPSRWGGRRCWRWGSPAG